MYTRKKKGFTIFELLMIIAILGLLAVVVIPNVKTARLKGQIAKVEAQSSQIRNALVLLAANSKEWPGHVAVDFVDTGAGGNEIWDLNVQAAGITQTDGLFGGWEGPYMNVVPPDPWGNNYFFDPDYDISTSGPAVWAAVIGSFGPNGVGQNLFDGDDIILVVSATSS